MLFRDFLLSVRKFSGLIVILFLLLCYVGKGLFSVLAYETASFASIGVGTPVAPLQATTTLLALRFENSLNGEQGELPVQGTGITFQTGVSGQGGYMDRGNRLTYASDGNLSSTEGTIELWLKPSWSGNDGQNHTILRYGASNGYMILGKEGNDLRLVLNRANDTGSLELDVFTSIENWQADQWHHVAASWSNNGKFLRLYVDGTLVSERSFFATLPTISSTLNPTFQIGGDSIRFPLLATIDDVNISDAARSAQEIASRMLQSVAITGATLTPSVSTIELYPGWTYWQDFKYTAGTPVGTVTLPWQVAGIAISNAAIATIDSLTGRLKAVAPGTATITASFNGLQSVITVNVLTPQQAVAEETIDAYLSTPASGALYQIPVAILRYFPTRDGINVDAAAAGYTSTLDALRTKQLKVEKKLKFMLEDGSRFRGYGAAAPAPSLGYRVVKILNVYEDVPPGLPTATSGVYYPDYKQILQRCNAEDLVTQQGVKEIWLEQYVNGRLALNESNMASAVTGDVSHSLRTNDDLPVYAKGYTVFGLNFAQGENLAARARGHHLEALLTYANVLQDRDDVLFQEAFIGRDVDGSFLPGRCGKTDRPPNSTSNFDFNNPIAVDSDIEDWFPDGRGILKMVNNDTWGNLTYNWPETPEGKTEGQWYIYWMQAMPGRNNPISRLETERITNWWQFTADWDAAMQVRLGLSEPLSCQYTLSSTSRNFPGNGGTGSVNVTSGSGCKWLATTSAPWLKVTSATGTGNGPVHYTVEATTVGRTGTIVIAGNIFTITQSSVNCTFTLSAASQNAAAGASGSSVNVTAAAGCTWTAASNSSWLTITAGSSGNGNGTVNFNVAANTGPARSGTLTIAEQTFTVNQSSGCTYALSAATRSVVIGGGTDSVNVTTVVGCAWTATSNVAWLTINSGASGTGNGTVNYTVAANSGAARTGTITVNGQTLTINQSSGCVFTLSATSQSVASSSAVGSVNVTTSANCAWTAIVNASNSWLTISSGSSGNGNGTVNFNVAANTGPARSGTLTIAGQTYTVNQATGCTYMLSATSQAFSLNGGSSSVTVSAVAGCAWTAVSNVSWVTITAGSSGTGNGTVNFTVAASDGVTRNGTLTIAGQMFTINQGGNQPPSIVLVSTITRQQGASAAAVTIATVSDAETPLGNLVVTTTSVPTGLSVTSLTNNNGTVSAVITASCQAVAGSNAIGLRVTDALGAAAVTTLTVNVTSGTSCFLQVADATAGDQRVGSVLLYSYYTSSISAPGLQNTQLRLTNTHETLETAVRLYFVDGRFATVLSLFICLLPNQTANFLMSETDPDVTGYVIAVAVNKTSGCPINFNFLTGGATLKLSSGHSASLGAMAVAALATNPVTCAAGNGIATLNFDGTNYGRLPKLLVLDSLPSLKDSNDTRLILARIGGSLVNNVGALGTIAGKIYNSNRAAQDFTFSEASPQISSSLSNNFPRLATRLDTFINTGQSGWLRLWSDANIGIIGAALNLSGTPRLPRGFAGGYNLPQGGLASAVSLDIPISVPTCQ